MSFYDHEPPDSEEDEAVVAQVDKTSTVVRTRTRTTPDSIGHENDTTTTSPRSLEFVNTSAPSDTEPLSSPTKRRRLTFTQPHDDVHEDSPASASPADFYSPANSWHLSPHSGWTPPSSANVVKALDFAAAYSELMPTSSNSALVLTSSDANQAEITAIPETRPDTATTGSSYDLQFDTHAIGGSDFEPVAGPSNQEGFNEVSESLSRIYLETPAWPLTDREQARLLRYYVENLARNFDLSDPYRHFRTVVPQRAATCPTLLNAIFALSARDLSRLGEYDPLISNQYHQECLKDLIPMLDDRDAILDENLLACTIILRHLEEIEVPLTGQSPSEQQGHLLGAHALIAAQERATLTGGLRHAAFWVGLRQEIYVAFCNQRSIMPALEHCNIDRSFEAAEDHVWACRMVVLCADVIRYCFGEDDQMARTFNWLVEQITQWYNCKPPSFTPVYFKEADDGNVFPEVWFLGDEILLGWQYYHIAQILLAAHNPKIPRIGPNRAAALRIMDEDIKEHVRMLCGMCQSNEEMRWTFVYASMAVTMAGDKFSERHEQEALLNVLDIYDRRHAYPTAHAQENLKAAWGWTQGISNHVT